MEVASLPLGTPADADAGTGPSARAHFLACIGGVLCSLTLPGLYRRSAVLSHSPWTLPGREPQDLRVN